MTTKPYFECLNIECRRVYFQKKRMADHAIKTGHVYDVRGDFGCKDCKKVGGGLVKGYCGTCYSREYYHKWANRPGNRTRLNDIARRYRDKHREARRKGSILYNKKHVMSERIYKGMSHCYKCAERAEMYECQNFHKIKKLPMGQKYFIFIHRKYDASTRKYVFSKSCYLGIKKEG